MERGKENSKKEVLQELENLRQKVAELEILKRQYEWTEKRLQESEERYRAFFEQAPDSIVLIDVETGALVEFNNRTCEVLGYTRKEFARLKLFDYEVSESPEEVRKHFDKIVKKGGDIFETKHKTKKGEIRIVLVSAKPISIDGRSFIQSIWKDITERKKAEKLYLENERKFFTLLSNMPGMAYRCQNDRHWTMEFVSQGCKKLTGYKPQDIVNNSRISYNGLIHPDDRDMVWNSVQKALKEKAAFTMVYRIQTFSGQVKWVWEQGRGIYSDQGKLLVLEGFITDISERKKNEEELLITKYVFGNMADAAFWINPDGNIFYVNNAACSLLGYSCKELTTMKIFDIDLNFFPESWARRWKEMKRDKIGKIETKYITKEGKQFPVEIHGKYMKDDGREYLCAIVRDVTERWRVEGAMRRAEEEKTGILDSLSEMVAYYGKDMRILWANKAAGVACGSSPVELVGSRCYSVWHNRKIPCNDCPVVKAFKTGNYEESDVALPDGRDWFVRAHPVKDLEGEVSGVVEVISDITVKKKIEQERKQSLNKSRRILEETVIALAATAERRDPYTAGHQRRVAHLACAIAEEMNLDEDKIEGIRMASIIHDVGKVYVPSEMLSKPSELSDLEFSIIKTHPQIGYDILKPVEFPWPIAVIVLQHHEKMDGSGYPKGIFGKDILIETKILTVADVVEAMASYRPYRAALGIDKALAEIKENRGILYDEQVVDSCIQIFKKKQFKFE